MSKLHSKILLSGFLLFPSLMAMGQAGGDGNGSDMGADPGLPAEAPQAPVATPPPSPRAPRSQSQTLPAPPPEPLVQPYSDAPTPAPSPLSAPTRQRTPVLNGKLAELNLSAEQAQQIIEQRKQWKPENEKRLKEEFNFLKQNLAQAMADNSPGEEVRRRFEAMQKKYLELQTVKFEKLLRIREVLTPDQRKKFAELRSRPSSNKNSPAGAGGDND